MVHGLVHSALRKNPVRFWFFSSVMGGNKTLASKSLDKFSIEKPMRIQVIR